MLATLRTLAVSQYIKHPFNCAFMPKKRKLNFFWVPDELGSQIVLRICSDHWSFRIFRPIWVPKSLAWDMAVKAGLVWPKNRRNLKICRFFRLFLLLSSCYGVEWPGTTTSSPRQTNITLWATFEYMGGGLGARMRLRESSILRFSSYFQTVSFPITL